MQVRKLVEYGNPLPPILDLDHSALESPRPLWRGLIGFIGLAAYTAAVGDIVGSLEFRSHADYYGSALSSLNALNHLAMGYVSALTANRM